MGFSVLKLDGPGLLWLGERFRCEEMDMKCGNYIFKQFSFEDEEK